MKSYLIQYTNRKNQVKIKSTKDDKELYNIIQKLDKAIEKGTCNGYLITTI